MDAQINFRVTAGFVTDGAGQTYSLMTDNYPTTRGGFTFGIETGGWDGRDRDNTLDPRFAGLNFVDAAGASNYWRLDLDAANAKEIRLAAGDASNPQTISFKLRDGTTDFATISGTTGGAKHFLDATSVDLTDTTWPGSNAAVTHTFGATDFHLRSVAGSRAMIAHVRVKDAASPPPPAAPWLPPLVARLPEQPTDYVFAQ